MPVVESFTKPMDENDEPAEAAVNEQAAQTEEFLDEASSAEQSVETGAAPVAEVLSEPVEGATLQPVPQALEREARVETTQLSDEPEHEA